MTTSKLLWFSVALVCLVAGSTQAAVPGLISYQGRLTTSSGAPVADGAYLIKFQIYDSAVGGSVVWNSNYQNVQVQGGIYSYVLGQDVPFPSGLFAGGNRWLGITVGVDPEMTPRQQMIATGYAFVSQNADSVNWGGIKNIPAGFADGIDDNSGGDIAAVNTSGGLTGGTTSGDANLAIASGGVTSTHIADGTIVDADLSASADISPSKIAGGVPTLTGSQLFTGTNTFNNTIIVGDSTARFDNTSASFGRITAPPSAILSVRRMYQSGLNNFGVYSWLQNSSAGPLYALYGLSRASTPGSTNGGSVRGLYARGESDGYPRYGVQAIARSLTPGSTLGTTYGVASSAYWGHDAIGVYGTADSTTFGRGVQGEVHANVYGYGVHGIATDNQVYGYGVLGEAYANGVASYAGYFIGDVYVSGNILMPSLMTQIDHPLDPENQILRLAGVDSPEMKTIHDGVVTTDANGEAIVEMPPYVEALNGEFRYQLTAIGEFVQAIIAKKLENGSFSIKTEKPHVEVCWQVTGVRRDAFAKANPLSVESQKRPEERGFYLHPEAFGLSRDRGVDAQRSPKTEAPPTNVDLMPDDREE